MTTDKDVIDALGDAIASWAFEACQPSGDHFGWIDERRGELAAFLLISPALKVRALEAERDDAIASEKRARLMLEGNEFRAVMLEEEQRRKKAEAERDALIKAGEQAAEAGAQWLSKAMSTVARAEKAEAERDALKDAARALVDDMEVLGLSSQVAALRNLLNKEPG